jgi:cellulose synthase/poly-beta-1,6-N-acetylglucosamine synthase-like glycosyltransferase
MLNQTLALLIPAHNEELVLAQTIKGAQAARVALNDIYLVDDSSTDGTLDLARKLLGDDHVLHVVRSGKAGAIGQGLAHFDIYNRYDWVQIIDADSIFSQNYFTEVEKQFKPDVVAVSGQVKSLRNSWITAFRAYEYTICHDFYKLIQSHFNLITVMPGPASCFKTSILRQLEFSTDTLTEDFDLTLQIHYKKLGRIAYAPKAISWTQDPPTLPIYCKQVNRWYTGFFQVIRKHRVGSHIRPIDAMVLFLALDGFLYIGQLLLYIAVLLGSGQSISPITIFAMDFQLFFILVWYAALRTRRYDLLLPMPWYYVLRIINISMFCWAAAKVFLLPKGKQNGMWNTGRVAHQVNTIPSMEGGVS